MGYTVKKVARMSGVSVRTLHFYDEVELTRVLHASTLYFPSFLSFSSHLT